MPNTIFKAIGMSLLIGATSIANANIIAPESRSVAFAYPLEKGVTPLLHFDVGRQSANKLNVRTVTARNVLASNLRTKDFERIPCVPEPATYALLGIGLIALLVTRRHPRSDIPVSHQLHS